MERTLVFHQSNYEVTHGMFPFNPEVNVRLAALQAQAQYGNMPPAASPKFEDTIDRCIESFYPMHLKDNTSASLKAIGREVADVWSGLAGSGVEWCEAEYLLTVSRWEHYGATLYRVEERLLTENMVRPFFLAVGETCIWLLDSETLKPVSTFDYHRLLSFGSTGKDFMLVVNSIRRGTEKPTTEKRIFQMDQVRDATNLITTYIN
eukprot:Opistho-1_new@14802